MGSYQMESPSRNEGPIDCSTSELHPNKKNKTKWLQFSSLRTAISYLGLKYINQFLLADSRYNNAYLQQKNRF